MGEGLPGLHRVHGRVLARHARAPEGTRHRLRPCLPRAVRKIAAYRDSRGWTFPWYSSYGSDFNYDFHVTLDAAVTPVEYNYRSHAELIAINPEWENPGPTEMPGFSCFLRDGDAIYHTYSTYARGTEMAGNDAYSLLDLTALGRQEEWEEPKGRASSVHGADPTFT
jgi:predicted dithiol-disulfide oxidoreductase (DUF899 family)